MESETTGTPAVKTDTMPCGAERREFTDRFRLQGMGYGTCVDPNLVEQPDGSPFFLPEWLAWGCAACRLAYVALRAQHALPEPDPVVLRRLRAARAELHRGVA